MLWYCSDNGPEGKTARSGRNCGSTGGLRGRKRSLFEGGIRVPGILEWPSRIKPGRSTSIPCSTSDYVPTVAEAAGLEIWADSRPMDGLSLIPLIEGRMASRGKPIAFQCPDAGERGTASRLGSPDHALIGDRFKLLSYLDDARDEEDMLFDLALDQGEDYNIADQRRNFARKMKRELRRWDAACSKSHQGADY